MFFYPNIVRSVEFHAANRPAVEFIYADPPIQIAVEIKLLPIYKKLYVFPVISISCISNYYQ